MRAAKSYFVLLGAFVLAVLDAGAQKGPKVGLILPGTGVAEVKLRDDASRFEAVFPNPNGNGNGAPSGTVGEGCPEQMIYWVDIELGETGVNAYLTNGRISQFSVHTSRFALPGGIKTGATEPQIKRAFPKGQAYVLLGSNSKVNGGRNLVYWVDKGDGVAFELAWSQNKKARLLNGIDVFRKDTEYHPEGCISPPQEWRQMK